MAQVMRIWLRPEWAQNQCPCPHFAHNCELTGQGGYAIFVDERTTVSYRDGMAAALKLAEALRKEKPEIEMARMRADMGRVVDAVKESSPKRGGPNCRPGCGENPLGRIQPNQSTVFA